MAYLLSPNESKHVMKVTEAISGNGAIDLTKDTAEIRLDNLCMLNNRLYYNENGNAYTVAGTAGSAGTPLTVSGKDIAITLKDANLTSTGKSPLALTEGAELTVRGEGMLNASGASDGSIRGAERPN